MDNESRVLAEDSLREELLSNFNLEITNSEISSLLQWRNFAGVESFFERVSNLLGKFT